MTETPPVVQRYEFVPLTDTAEDEHPRSGTLCQIVTRAKASDTELRDAGPLFVVQFGDGHVDVIAGSELRPWYPV